MLHTYLLGWRDQDLWYYGFRAANRVRPEDDLCKVYFTNSIYVKAKIRELGLPDVIRVHKRFASKQEARAYESKFLTRVGAVRSSRWLNRHNGSSEFVPGDVVTATHRQKISKANMGKKRSEEARRKMSEKRKAFLASPAGQLHLQKMIDARKGKPVWNKGSTLTQEQKEKISLAKKGKPSKLRGSKRPPETIAKMEAAGKNRKPPSDETRKKNSDKIKAWWAAGRPPGGL